MYASAFLLNWIGFLLPMSALKKRDWRKVVLYSTILFASLYSLYLRPYKSLYVDLPCIAWAGALAGWWIARDRTRKRTNLLVLAAGLVTLAFYKQMVGLLMGLLVLLFLFFEYEAEKCVSDRDHGKIVWVMGPAFAFDHDAREAFSTLIANGYVDALLAGNALATHDLEGAMLNTALGQDIYTQKSMPNGHYNHLDVDNRVRRSGSIPQFIEDYDIDNGIIYSCVKNDVPIVLTGSIRDDGPIPEVIGDVYQGQDKMRSVIRKTTTVICLATMLHTIATGNMTPSFRVLEDGTVRPVFLYTVDADEFVVNKLLDRGSLAATTIVTNVQDFIAIIANGLKLDWKQYSKQK